METPPNLDGLTAFELRALVIELLERVSDLSRIVLEQREEIARLKGLKGRPDIKPPSTPSGMEKASRPASSSKRGKRRGGGPKTAQRTIHETRVIEVAVPEGSRSRALRISSCRTWWCARM